VVHARSHGLHLFLGLQNVRILSFLVAGDDVVGHVFAFSAFVAARFCRSLRLDAFPIWLVSGLQRLMVVHGRF